METTNEKNVQESEQSTRKTIIGELALLVAVLINSFGCVFDGKRSWNCRRFAR